MNKPTSEPDSTLETARDKRRALQRERHRQRAAERAALGLCTRCGTRAPAPGRRQCEPCRAKAREAERARYAAGKRAGKLYGGRRVATRRRDSRERGRERHRARRATGLCTMCGRDRPVEGEDWNDMLTRERAGQPLETDLRPLG